MDDCDNDLAKSPCPDCGGVVYWYLTCHTWPNTGPGGRVTYMSCLPCDSATHYSCYHCDWEYTAGLNPNNPRSAKNEEKRHGWAEGHVLAGIGPYVQGSQSGPIKWPRKVP